MKKQRARVMRARRSPHVLFYSAGVAIACAKGGASDATAG
jgi:hypothetical protein